jgi:dCMP deaminase
MNRPTVDKTYLEIAKLWAKRATCARKKVGCVLVDENGEQISYGYNGANHGESHCTDVGCLVNDQGRCIRCNHAEMNAIFKARKEDLKNATAYVTTEPCENCTRSLVQCGVVRIVFIEPYPNPYNQYFAKNILWEQWSE